MVSITREKRGGTVRINISAQDFADLAPDDVGRALVKHWIDLGREREGVRDHIDEVIATHFAAQKEELDALGHELEHLKSTLDSLVAFFTQVAHALIISTTAKSHFELESIHFDKTNGNKLRHEDDQTYKLAQIKHAVFKQLLSRFFPELEHRFNLTNYLRQEEHKDA